MPRAKKQETSPEGENTAEKPKGSVTEVSDQDKTVANLAQQVQHLSDIVKELNEARKQDAKEKEALKSSLSKHEETMNPGSGPGPECQAFHIHRGEALQLRETAEAGIFEPVPAGLKVKEVDGMNFLVKAEHPDDKPALEGMVANCRSLYTEKYEYFMPKRPGQMTREKGQAYLCRKHANVLLGVPSDQKASGINEINE